MSIEGLANIMKNLVQRGESIEQVKRSFINAGYSNEEVEKAFEILNRRQQLRLSTQKTIENRIQNPQEKPKRSWRRILILVIIILIIFTLSVILGFYWDSIINFFDSF